MLYLTLEAGRRSAECRWTIVKAGSRQLGQGFRWELAVERTSEGAEAVELAEPGGRDRCCRRCRMSRLVCAGSLRRNAALDRQDR